MQTNTNRQEYCQRKPDDKELVIKDGILCKSENLYVSKPWTITSVHTNGTMRFQSGMKSERLNIGRVAPFLNKLKQSVCITPLSITTLTLHHCKPSVSYLRIFFSSRRFYIFISIDPL
jgi:hypothetical protein